MRLFLNTLLRLVSGTYFVLTSIYCLLAFLPYTFFFLIKAPPYAWMPWFVHHQALLYCLAAVAAVAANWRVREAWTGRNHNFLGGTILLAAVGVYLAFRPFLATMDDSRKAYWWSLASLLALIALALWRQVDPVDSDQTQNIDRSSLSYSGGALLACVISLIYALPSKVHIYSEARTLGFHWTDAEFTLWSLLSHLVLAVVVVSVINLIFLFASKTAKARSFRRCGISTLVFVSLCIALSRFLANALS